MLTFPSVLFCCVLVCEVAEAYLPFADGVVSVVTFLKLHAPVAELNYNSVFEIVPLAADESVVCGLDVLEPDSHGLVHRDGHERHGYGELVGCEVCEDFHTSVLYVYPMLNNEFHGSVEHADLEMNGEVYASVLCVDPMKNEQVLGSDEHFDPMKNEQVLGSDVGVVSALE